MGSTYGNLFNEIIILIQGLCGVLHVIMNSKGVGVETGTGTISGQDRADVMTIGVRNG